MSTRKVKLIGPVFWSKVFPDNRDLTGFEDALKDSGGQTSIDIDLDAENMDKLRRSKSMKKGTNSPDNDGLTRVKLTRRWTDQYAGGAPTVLKPDGTPWDFDEDGFIGNGSIAEVTVHVYDTARKSIVGTRLEKVKVLEHKVYEPDAQDDDIPEPAPAPKGPLKANPVGKVKASTVDEDDEIPF